jgi:menaquinone-9 beta-reductase
MTDCDALIAGAGPAGTSLAIRLVNAGLRVVLIEKSTFPREKLCGEFISPECRSHFAELGVTAAIDAAAGASVGTTVFYARSGRNAAVESEWFGDAHPNALGLSRAKMDNLLLDRAKGAGVEVLDETTATGLLRNGEKVIGIRIKDRNGAERELCSSLTVDATGRAASLVRRLGDKRNLRPAGLVAFKTHLSGAAIAVGTCEIYGYRGGYGGCIQVEQGMYNLCFIARAADVRARASDPERVFREILCTNRRAAEVLTDACPVEDWLAVAIERFGPSEPVPADGLLAVGDAAAFNDPFTGSGILMALENGRIAADVIMRHWPSRRGLAAAYRGLYSTNLGARFRASSLIRRTAFVPAAAELMVLALKTSTRLRRRIAVATRS